MTKKTKKLITILVGLTLVLNVSCSSPVNNPTPDGSNLQSSGTSIPTVLSSNSTAEPEPVWVLLNGSEKLLHRAMWQCVDNVRVRYGGIDLGPAPQDLTVSNLFGPYLTVNGDFSIMADVYIIGKPPQSSTAGFSILVGSADPSQQSARIDIGMIEGKPGVRVWDGQTEIPDDFFPNSPISGGEKAAYSMSRVGETLIFQVDGKEITRISSQIISDPNLYIGAFAAQGAEVRIFSLDVSVPEKQEGNVEFQRPVVRVSDLPDNLPLRCYANVHGILFGTGINNNEYKVLTGNVNYLEAESRQFDFITPSYMLKFAAVHTAPDQYDFTLGDTLLEQAKSYDFQVRGHTLVWGQALPDWILNGTFTKEQATEILHGHIVTEIAHYKGTIPIWDVVNEAIDPSQPDGFNRNYWYNTMGPEYIDLAFQWAHEEDPGALLFYNDYYAEGRGHKSDLVYELVKGMVERGVPIHGVGLQSHFDLQNAPSFEDVIYNMERLNNLGLQVQITEMDVIIDNQPGSLEERLQKQADIFEIMLHACLQASNCTGFTVWGSSDADVWQRNRTGQPDGPTMVDENGIPKPAYFAISDILRMP